MFSVVIASRDRVALLQRTVAALADQTMPPSAVIVVDDGSTDGTWDWLSGLDFERLVTIRTEGVGVSEARNRGLERVVTPWVVFLDDDDTPDPMWLEALVELVDEDVGIVSCAMHYEPAGERPNPPTNHPGLDGRALFLTGAYAARVDLVRDAGGFMAGLSYSENTELSLRLIPVCGERGLRSASTDEPLLTVRWHDQRRSKTNRHHAILRVVGAHPDTFDADRPRASRWLAVAGVDAFRSGEHRLARRVLARSFRVHPRPRTAARLLLAIVSPAGRRVWAAGNVSVHSEQP